MTFTNPDEDRILAGDPMIEDFLNRKVLSPKMQQILAKLPQKAVEKGRFIVEEGFPGVENDKVAKRQAAAMEKAVRFIEGADLTALEFIVIARMLSELSITIPVLLIGDVVDAMQKDSSSDTFDGVLAGHCALMLLRTNETSLQEAQHSQAAVVMTIYTLLSALGVGDLFHRYMSKKG